MPRTARLQPSYTASSLALTNSLKEFKMCLLLTATSAKMRDTLLNTEGLIADIYAKNSDGLGAMYATTAGLKVVKTLPKNAEDVRKFIQKLPDDGRELALHFRWRTHGDINLAQCHPYVVSTGTALMHNGILDTGNAADPSKSDTWHFIEDYLKLMSVDALHDPKVTEMIGEFIGQNKFAIMSADGRLTVINKDQGISHDAVWFSNTYAWTPSLLIPTYPKPRPFVQGGSKGWVNPYKSWYNDDEDMDDLHPFDRTTGSITYDVREDVDTAVEEYNTEEMTCLLEEFPLETLRHLFATYDVSEYVNADDNDLTVASTKVRKMLIDNDLRGLMDALEDDLAGVVASRVAETLLYFCTVDCKMEVLS